MVSDLNIAYSGGIVSYANLQTGSLISWGQNDHIYTSIVQIHGRQVGRPDSLGLHVERPPGLTKYINNTLKGAYSMLIIVFKRCKNLDRCQISGLC